MVFLTFCVIAVTLVGQGLSLPYLIRKLRVRGGGQAEREELTARLVVTKAAITRIDELGGVEWTRDDTVQRMRSLYEYPQAALGRTGREGAGRRLRGSLRRLSDDGARDPRGATGRAAAPAGRRHDLRRRDAQSSSESWTLEDQRLEIQRKCVVDAVAPRWARGHCAGSRASSRSRSRWIIRTTSGLSRPSLRSRRSVSRSTPMSSRRSCG